MKLYNAKLGRIIEGTPMMAKLLAIKGWVELPEEEPVNAAVNEVDPIDEPELIITDVASGNTANVEDLSTDKEQQKPKADPVKVKAKTKTKK